MSNLSGWVKVYRQIRKKDYYRKPEYLALWVHLLLMANHESNQYSTNGQVIDIKPGQFITGRELLSRETGIPETNIERILNRFQNGHQIGQQKTTKYRLITILNWEQYQIVDRRTDAKRTTNGQQMDTNKKKEDKNKEEEKSASISYLTEIPETDMTEFLARFDTSRKFILSKAEDLKLYCARKGKLYKNYKAFLLKALKNDCTERKIAPIHPQETQIELTPEQIKATEDKRREIAEMFKLKMA